MDLLTQALILSVVAVAVFVGTGALLPMLRARAILDHPNERSSHDNPTPKGGGIVLIPVIVLAWVCVGPYWGGDGPFIWVVPTAALLLAGLSWIDDLRSLPPIVRLLVQIGAVFIVLGLNPLPGLVFQGLLPPLPDIILTGLLWVWFINLFNFMDGIDGITGAQSLVIGLGIGLVGGDAAAIGGLIIAAASLGFLKWNWHPAKIFMGDVGSVPLGFLLGWLLLDTAAAGHWAAALILPGYYLADAGITLTRRAFRGEKIWLAHRQHYYQQAVQRGLSHGQVSQAVFAVGVVLMALAWAAEQGWALPALIGAVVFSLGFLRFLAGPRT